MVLISLLSKGLSTVFSSTTIRKHQFFSAQTSSKRTQLFWLQQVENMGETPMKEEQKNVIYDKDFFLTKF